MNKPLVNCECNSSFFLNSLDLKEREVDNNLTEVYYITPCCGKENIVMYKNQRVKDIENKLKNCPEGIDKRNLLQERREVLDLINKKNKK